MWLLFECNFNKWSYIDAKKNQKQKSQIYSAIEQMPFCLKSHNSQLSHFSSQNTIFFLKLNKNGKKLLKFKKKNGENSPPKMRK